ncbi:protein BIG GRAIN 1-like E [Rutidosis leptorrhynchoides]|uniref:protein BIG GRAIN 1-like E n=1 Tax=Rutidosis leptorrhynchoides TaxID=125765 RepID=UPI003A9997C5
MSNILPHSSQPTRNSLDELDVFEAARYFSGANENFFIGNQKAAGGKARILGNNTQKYSMRPFGRMSLDMPSHRENSNPLQAIFVDNPIMIKKEIKKSKQPSSPGGKLAHFLNSLFNQTSSKKSKSKSKSTKDQDESPSSWRRKRRSSISHFTSANNSFNNTNPTILSDSRSQFSNSTSSGFRTPPHYHMIAHTPTKTSSYRDTKSYSYSKPPPSQITKIPINGNLNNIDNKHMSVEKVNIFDYKQGHHPDKYILKEDINDFKRFIKEDDGDSDSSSDLFELTNCDLGFYSSGLPVYETTHMDSINRGAPIAS